MLAEINNKSSLCYDFNEEYTIENPVPKMECKLPSISYASVVSDNEGSIFVVGGENGPASLTSVFRINTNTGHQIELPKMIERRVAPGAHITEARGSMGKTLWVIGGMKGLTFTANMEFINIEDYKCEN